jgi:hypothetical protein
MPVQIPEVTIKARVSNEDVETRLARLEKVVQIQACGSLENVVIQASGSVILSGGVAVHATGGSGVVIEAGLTKVEVTPSKAVITSPGTVQIDSSVLKVNSSTLAVNTAMANFSGTVKANTMITNTIVAATYTPGAGNVW